MSVLRLVGIPLFWDSIHDAAQRPKAVPGAVEIFWQQPLLKRRTNARPFPIDDGVPRGIPTSPLVNNRLTEEALETKSIAFRRRLGSGIQAIAFPFIATIPQVLEDPVHEKIGRFRADAAALHARRPCYTGEP